MTVVSAIPSLSNAEGSISVIVDSNLGAVATIETAVLLIVGGIGLSSEHNEAIVGLLPMRIPDAVLHFSTRGDGCKGL
jgi:hypothetical protein